MVGVLAILENGISNTPGFVQGLKEEGFVGGQNVTFESHLASGQLERLPGLAADLRVDLILTRGLDGATGAKAATSTIVFFIGEDPVRHGFVASLNRPGGNATGYTSLANQLIAKQLNLLHLALPNERVIGFLTNSNNPNADPDTKDAQAAARSLGLTLRPLAAASEREFERVFETVTQEQIGALLVGVDQSFRSQREKLTALAARHAIPTLYEQSFYAEAGGLMSYGTDFNEGYRQCGIYVGRILKGAKPADLPVQQSTRFELAINLKTAKALGLTIPPQLLALADEAIE